MKEKSTSNPVFLLKVSEEEKYKNDCEWFKNYMNYIIPSHNAVIEDFDIMKMSYEIINNDLSGLSIDEMNNDLNNNKQLIGIGERCFINNAIVDKNCRIGNDVHINGGKHLENTSNELYAVKDGIVVIKKGAILPNGFSIK